jgi:hypothetical protein
MRHLLTHIKLQLSKKSDEFIALIILKSAKSGLHIVQRGSSKI